MILVTPGEAVGLPDPLTARHRVRGSVSRGPAQRAIRRAFVASDTEVLTSSSIYDWAHIRRRLGRRKSMPFGVYSRTLRTLRAMCEQVERVPPHGAWLWRLRNTADD